MVLVTGCSRSRYDNDRDNYEIALKDTCDWHNVDYRYKNYQHCLNTSLSFYVKVLFLFLCCDGETLKCVQ